MRKKRKYSLERELTEGNPNGAEMKGVNKDIHTNNFKWSEMMSIDTIHLRIAKTQQQV